MPHPAAATVDDSPLQLVTAGGQLVLEHGDERAQIGGRRAWVHLGDEEDSHEPLC